MTYKEAKELKEKYDPIIIGRPYIMTNGADVKSGYTITHIFIAPSKDPFKTINVWTASSTIMSNDEAILRTAQLTDDFEIYIFSYSSWGDGNLYHRPLSKYLEQTGL